ncbi:elongation factor P [Myxococcota bacterium]|nr:elongation factor P [Myxococcota bacterium]
MYSTSDFRKGLKIEIDGEPWLMVDNQFVKPGKGQAFNRTRIKSLITGRVIDRTFKSGETVGRANVEEHEMQYLYSDGEHWNFMNTETFEQIQLTKDQLDDAWKWLQENGTVQVVTWNDRPISVEPPMFVVMEITYCEPGIKGDTATGATKPATLTTGATVNVPLFVEMGDRIKVDTRTGSYIERVRG